MRMQYIRTLSDIASACSLTVTRGPCLASAHWELRVALARSQGYVYRSCALLLAKVAERLMLNWAVTAPLIV
jgi:hypothetical protein